MAEVTVKGGDKLANALAKIATGLATGSTMKAGFMQGATYPDGTPVAMIAAIHNYGAPMAGIPARPFFTNVVKKGQKTWGNDIKTILKVTGMDGKKTLELMGEKIKGEIQDEIVHGNFVPLKPATVKRKGFATPLIDTAHMKNSVTFDVK